MSIGLNTLISILPPYGCAIRDMLTTSLISTAIRKIYIHHISTPMQPRSVQATPYDYEKVKLNFCWAPIKAITRTIKYTTQNQVLQPYSFLRKRFQSPHSYMNARRRNEFDATNMIYSNTKAHGTGVTTAHLFTGCTSKLLLDGYACKTGHSADFLQAMQQRNITRGVPSN